MAKKVAGYSLQRYIDPITGEDEWIWNSRPGPVLIDIVSRAGNRAEMDRKTPMRYAPDYTPAVGDRVFVDVTPLRARQLADEHVRLCETLQPPYDEAARALMHEQHESREDAVAHMATFFERLNCDLITVTHGWLDGLLHTRATRTAAGLTPLPDQQHGIAGVMLEAGIPLDAVTVEGGRRVVRRDDVAAATDINIDPALLALLQDEPHAGVLISLVKTAVKRAKEHVERRVRATRRDYSRNFEISFRSATGEEINVVQWITLHEPRLERGNILAHTSLYRDGAVDFGLITAWNGVDVGDGLIFEHVVVAHFSDDGEAYSRIVRWSKAPAAAAEHVKLLGEWKAKLMAGDGDNSTLQSLLNILRSAVDAEAIVRKKSKAS